MCRTNVDSAIGLMVEKVFMVRLPTGYGIDLQLTYGTQLQIRAGGDERATLSATLDGEPIYGAVDQEIAFIHYDDDRTTKALFVLLENGKELIIRSSGEGATWVEASLH